MNDRAQAGITKAQSSADTANQNAQNASQEANTADTAANDVAHRADSLDSVVKGLDNYKEVTKASVTFGFDKAMLTADDKAQLDTFAGQLGSAKSYILEVTGGTDSTGPAQYNYELSQRRADAVVQYLAAKYNIAAAPVLPDWHRQGSICGGEQDGGRAQGESARAGAAALEYERRQHAQRAVRGDGSGDAAQRNAEAG